MTIWTELRFYILFILEVRSVNKVTYSMLNLISVKIYFTERRIHGNFI